MFGLSRKAKEQRMSRGYKFELGEMVKDKVTDFEGVIVGRSNYISGCDTFGVQPKTLKDGAVQDVKWFDEPRLQSTHQHMDIVDAREPLQRTGADSVPQSTR